MRIDSGIERDPVTWHQLTEILYSHMWTSIWRNCWQRPIETKTCFVTWKVIIGLACISAKREWRSWKGGCAKHLDGGKGLIHFGFWPRIHWLGRTHDRGPPLWIWANSEKILSFSKFWVKKQVLQLGGSRAHALIFFGTLAGGNFYIFGFIMVNYASSEVNLAFQKNLDGQTAQKHHENHLAATFCTSRKYLWENEVLEDQIKSKCINSTWVGN